MEMETSEQEAAAAAASGARRSRACAVCGDSPAKVHYGVLACFGCKGFFRRAVKDGRNKYVCRYERNCLVNKFERNSCRYCRFRRCLQVGMNPDAVRPDRGDRHAAGAASDCGGLSDAAPTRARLKPSLSRKKSLARGLSGINDSDDDWTRMLAPEHRARLLDLIKLSKEVAAVEEQSFDSVSDFSLKSLIADRSLSRSYRACLQLPSTSLDTSFTAIWRVVSVVDWVDGLTKMLEKDRAKSAITCEDKLSLVQGAFCPLTLLSLCAHIAASPSLNDINAVRVLIDTAKLHYPVRDLVRRLSLELIAPLRHCAMSDTEFVLLRAIITLNPECPGLCSAAVTRLREVRAHLFDILIKAIKRSHPKSTVSPSAFFGQLLSLLPPLKHLAGDISTHLSTIHPRPSPPSPATPSFSTMASLAFTAILTDLFNPEPNDLVLAAALTPSSPSSGGAAGQPNVSCSSVSSVHVVVSSDSGAPLLYDLSACSRPSTTSLLLAPPPQALGSSNGIQPQGAPSPALSLVLGSGLSDDGSVCLRSAFQQPSPSPNSMGNNLLTSSSASSLSSYPSPLMQCQMMPPPPPPSQQMPPPTTAAAAFASALQRPSSLSFSSKLPLQLTKSIEEMLRPNGMAEDPSIINRPLASDWADAAAGMSTPVFNRDVVAQFFPEIAGQMNA